MKRPVKRGAGPLRLDRRPRSAELGEACQRRTARTPEEDLGFLDRLITEEQFVEIAAAFRRRRGIDVCTLPAEGGYLKRPRRGWARATIRRMVDDLRHKTTARA